MIKMKDSGIEWIGYIPANWELKRGKNIFLQRNTKGNENPVLLAASQKYGMYPQHLLDGVVQVKEDTDFQTFKTVHKNDYVISLRSFQGGFEMSDYEGVCSPAYQVLYNRIPIDYRYYKMLFKSDGFISKMNSLTIGIREGKNIQYSDFACSMILYPPLEMQHRIADYLDKKCAKIDAIIEKQQAVIEKLKEYKMSVITEAVTKGLNPDAETYDSEIEWIGTIPKTWKILKSKYVVKDIGDIDHYMPNSVDAGIPYIMTGDLKDSLSKINIENCKQVSDEDYIKLSKKLTLQKGDLIFARYATIGTVCLVDINIKCLVSYSCVVVKPNTDQIKSKYLMYYYKSKTFIEEIKQYSNSNTQENVGKDSMYRAKLCLPTLAEQENIIDFLDNKTAKIDTIIKNKQNEINKLTEYKKSLIYEVVTGKKEV